MYINEESAKRIRVILCTLNKLRECSLLRVQLDVESSSVYATPSPTVIQQMVREFHAIIDGKKSSFTRIQQETGGRRIDHDALLFHLDDTEAKPSGPHSWS